MSQTDRLNIALLALAITGSAFAQSSGTAELGPNPAAAAEPQTSVTASLAQRSELSHRPPAVEFSRRTADPVSPSEQRSYTDRFLQDRLGYWCKHLKLEEWQVSIAMVRRDSLRPKTLGKIQWDKKRKTAVIEVMDPSDYRLSFRPMLDDMEFTVVHELVHLSLASLPRSEASRSSEEHAVNRLAEALVRLDSRPKD